MEILVLSIFKCTSLQNSALVEEFLCPVLCRWQHKHLVLWESPHWNCDPISSAFQNVLMTELLNYYQYYST